MEVDQIRVLAVGWRGSLICHVVIKDWMDFLSRQSRTCGTVHTGYGKGYVRREEQNLPTGWLT